jgi:integrase
MQALSSRISASDPSPRAGLRYTGIAAALDTSSNGDVRAAQAHARHASPQTTLRYDDNWQDLAGKVAAGLAEVLTRF